MMYEILWPFLNATAGSCWRRGTFCSEILTKNLWCKTRVPQSLEFFNVLFNNWSRDSRFLLWIPFTFSFSCECVRNLLSIVLVPWFWSFILLLVTSFWKPVLHYKSLQHIIYLSIRRIWKHHNHYLNNLYDEIRQFQK